MDAHEPTEESPLLVKPSKALSSNFASSETLTNYDLEDGLTEEVSWATPPEQVLSGPEQTAQDFDEEQRLEGLPEVRKKFVYIVPAVTIGVSEHTYGPYFLVRIANDCPALSRRSRRYSRSRELWQNWERPECTE